MRIAELTSPEIRPSHHDSLSQLLSQLEASINQCELLSPEKPLPTNLSSDLRSTLSQLSSLVPFSNSIKLQIWKLSYRLWNACVDLSNVAGVRSSGDKVGEEVVKLRQVSADMLLLAGNVAGVPSPALKSASFYYKTGLIWLELRRFDLAASCFEKATDLTSKLDAATISDAGERKLLLDLNIARSRTAWDVSDRNLAVTLLNRAKNLLFGSAEHYKALANQYLVFGKSALSKIEGCGVKEALKLMNEALDLFEKGLSTARTRNGTEDLKALRSKCLRFIAAVHLQGEEFESVLKCIRVLREGDGDRHPCLPVLAMKAWLGLGRYGEAEKELRGMVVNKGVPEGIWVSAIEAYFEAAGTAGAETAKGLFLGLLGRCHVSAGAAVRIAHRVVGEGGSGEGPRARAKVVAELVSDERVVALFAGEAAAKDRTAMHAVLWNCAADHFLLKDYVTSAEMFEKSMLYVPYNIENRILRAKGFRVLCLCHLGLSQLDQAQEYINEAEKLEPNIACAFLKFKIYLQKSDHNAAITHEAIACRAIPVAVASLANLLNFYSSGKPMPTTEVAVLRTLVTILTQDSGYEQEILKFMKRAHLRISELGPDCFFGKGEVGRRERNWFAVNAWNFGTNTGKEKNYEVCAEFLRLASEFYSVVLDGEMEENNVMVCKSLTLTVSAMLAAEKQKQARLLDTEVKQAIKLLERAGKILSSISSGTQLDDEQVTIIKPNLFFIYTFNAYDLHGRLNDLGSQQLLLVKSFASSKFCNPNHLLQIGLNASEGPQSNHEVATFALTECLSAFVSSPSPDYQNIALVVRRLISVASIHRGDTDDDAVCYVQASLSSHSLICFITNFILVC
ncbi:unnamed protein product, partial [Vitis vinifera]